MDRMETYSYYPAALESALSFVQTAVSDEAARVVAAIIAVRAVGQRELPLPDLTHAAGFGADVEKMRTCLRNVDAAVRAVFDEALVVWDVPERTPYSERPSWAVFDSDEPDPASGDARPETILLGSTFVSCLDEPFPRLTKDHHPPGPDAITASWVDIVAAAPASGTGHHLILRCIDEAPRETLDFARLVENAGSCVTYVDGTCGLSPELIAFQSELHAKDPQVVIIDRAWLVTASTAADDDDDDDWGLPVRRSALDVTRTSKRRLRRLTGLRNTYVWRAPGNGAFLRGLEAVCGGVVGPIGFTKNWSGTVVAAMAPGIGPAGTRALLTRVRDPRDTGALAAAARVAANALKIDLDAACLFVTRSLGGEVAPPQADPPSFDARLIVCDEEGQILLERADEIARKGGRVLLWGPPGGGKSTYAQVLAARMGERRISRVVTPGSILARPWGATERLLSDLWHRASADEATLIIDELDSMCGVRESGSSGGNAYLIRTLTDEWLRHFDGYPSVPVIATVNDVLAIDDAIRRRFAFVIEIRDELSPEGERLAWASMLKIEPPEDWTPCGASVSDFASAAARCTMLGLMTPDALAAAVTRAREARLGPGRKPTPGSRKGVVH